MISDSAFFSRFFRRRVLLLVGLGAAAMLAAGCDTLQPKAPEEIVLERAEARWAALVDGDFETAWTYTQPGFRAVVKQNRYHRRFGAAGTWKGAQVHEADCEAERCKVRVRVTTLVDMPRFRNREVTSSFDETWVREDGQWWYYQAL